MSRRHAPSVSYPVGRSYFLGWVLVLWCVAMGMLLVQLAISSAAWLTPFKGWPNAATLISLINLLLCTYLCWRWWRTPTGWLTWDPTVTEPLHDQPTAGVAAGGWWWTAAHGSQPTALGAPVVVLDCGGHLGLRLPARQVPHERNSLRLLGLGASHPGWLWVDARMQPERWLPLRRALQANRRP